MSKRRSNSKMQNISAQTFFFFHFLKYISKYLWSAYILSFRFFIHNIYVWNHFCSTVCFLDCSLFSVRTGISILNPDFALGVVSLWNMSLSITQGHMFFHLILNDLGKSQIHTSSTKTYRPNMFWVRCFFLLLRK